jgi:hypothetical protein
VKEAGRQKSGLMPRMISMTRRVRSANPVASWKLHLDRVIGRAGPPTLGRCCRASMARRIQFHARRHCHCGPKSCPKRPNKLAPGVTEATRRSRLLDLSQWPGCGPGTPPTGSSKFLNSPRISRPITKIWKGRGPRVLSRVRGVPASPGRLSVTPRSNPDRKAATCLPNAYPKLFRNGTSWITN